MADPKSILVNIHSIANIEDVITTLQQLDNKLVELGLHQFMLFNQSYQIVTHLIQQRVNDDYFKNPIFIEKFIVNFASYYFKAVNNAMDGNELSPPWSKLNDYAKIKSAPVFISLMLGANVHINNDLPRVLKEMMQDESMRNLFSDILKIDRILMKSGRQIIDLFEENNKFLDFLKRRLIFTYYRPAMYTILHWRVQAWRHYGMLKRDDRVSASITKRSLKIANRLLFIARFLGKNNHN